MIRSFNKDISSLCTPGCHCVDCGTKLKVGMNIIDNNGTFSVKNKIKCNLIEAKNVMQVWWDGIMNDVKKAMKEDKKK